MIGGKEEMLNRWAEYFEELLNGEGRERIQEEKGDEDEEREGDETEDEMNEEEAEEVTREEVRKAIASLKNNKAPGEDNIPAELLKHGGQEVEGKVYELIKEIWDKETMPRDWTMGVICPIHKKNDKLVCDNYRGIMLLNTAYKVFAQVLAGRLAPETEPLLGEYQCGFRPQRSTMDSIFVVRQVLEKCYEFDVDIHQLYIDFRKAYDSIKRN
jgi:sorting nexin-29